MKKRLFEDEEGFQKRKRNCPKIVELLESFERNQNETRFELRLKLGFAGKIDLYSFCLIIFLFFIFLFLIFTLSRW